MQSKYFINALHFVVSLLHNALRFLSEPAVLRGEQVASARLDGGVLGRRLHIPLHRRQTSDPEEVKKQKRAPRCFSAFKVITADMFIWHICFH